MGALSVELKAASVREEGTVALGRAVGRLLRAGDVVALEGELGAGKTRFVRGVCEGMGLDPSQVSSPTFVLVNEYAVRAAGAPSGVDVVPLRHVDAYRLRGGAEELESIGWDRVVDGSAAVVIEWASRLGAGFDAEPSLARVRIERGDVEGDGAGGLTHLEDEAEGRGERSLTIDVPDAWASRPEWDGFAAAWGAKGKLPEDWARCPTTGKAVAPDSPTFPFVDERARMADLGKWMTGNYLISREVKPEDVGEE
jgi:tRNA threonylcarbamoyladenosine biosynthesis protein TsaE